MAAGAFKLYDLAFEAQDESIPTQFIMVFAEAELLAGVWMMIGIDAERTRWWAAAAFSGLAVSSVFQIRAGKCSCGCFGSLEVNPWFALILDLAAVVAVLASRPPGATHSIFSASLLQWLGLGAIAILIGDAGWRQADLVTIAGTVTAADGQPLEEATLSFTGDSGKVVLRTDHEGNFRLRLVRPGLYAVSAPGMLRAPTPTLKQAGRKLDERTKQRSRQQSARPPLIPGSKALLWIEIPKCSEYDKIIRFEGFIPSVSEIAR